MLYRTFDLAFYTLDKQMNPLFDVKRKTESKREESYLLAGNTYLFLPRLHQIKSEYQSIDKFERSIEHLSQKQTRNIFLKLVAGHRIKMVS